MQSKTWRLIPLIQASGSVQMAIDRWLWEQHSLGQMPSVLRFYTWRPIALSLGYHQRRWPESWQKVEWQGQTLELVRRPTGGRAVLHQGDLTYAVITSGLGSRAESYTAICEFLIQGWRSLGIELTYGSAGRGYIHNPNCFGTATGADLVLPDGSKLIGSAQLRQGQTILQHGSMGLSPDPDLFRQVFGAELHALPQLPSTFSTETGQQKIMEALRVAAQSCFGGCWSTEPLSETEWQEIQDCERSRV